MSLHVVQDLTAELPAMLRKPYYQGRAAREAGKPLESCSIDNMTQASAWKCGWHDEDRESAKQFYQTRKTA